MNKWRIERKTCRIDVYETEAATPEEAKQKFFDTFYEDDDGVEPGRSGALPGRG